MSTLCEQAKSKTEFVLILCDFCLLAKTTSDDKDGSTTIATENVVALLIGSG